MAHNFEMKAEFDNDSRVLGGFSAIRQPFVVLSHIIFRASAVLFYIFANALASSFIIQFLTILIFHSIDLWIVKNITGRLLTGLRWWNFVDADGKNHWKFEISKNPENYDQFERKIFLGRSSGDACTLDSVSYCRVFHI